MFETKECLKQKYETLNTDLHNRINTESSAGEGAGLGAGLGAWTAGFGASTGAGLGAAQKFDVNQKVWYHSLFYKFAFPATILQVENSNMYKIGYTDNQRIPATEYERIIDSSQLDARKDNETAPSSRSWRVR
jgi:hypothetical protein